MKVRFVIKITMVNDIFVSESRKRNYSLVKGLSLFLLDGFVKSALLHKTHGLLTKTCIKTSIESVSIP